MTAADRFGMVLYDTDVYKIGDGLMQMDTAGKAKMLDEIERIAVGTSTNLSGGLVSGLEMIERVRASSAKKNEVSSLLLMTDGQANVGYRSTGDIVKCLTPEERARLPAAGRGPRDLGSARMRSARRAMHQTEESAGSAASVETEAATSGTLAASVYTFGFGSDHNADLLQAVSEAGNGMYYFIDTPEKIPESFADCLGGLLSTVGQNITMEVKSTNGVSVTSAFSGRDKKSSASGATCTLPLGDIQSEERRDILLKLKLPKLDAEQMDWHVLDAKLSYFNVITSAMEVQEARLSLSRPSTKRDDLESDDDVDTHKNRIMAAEAMQEAMLIAERGDMAQAQSVLQMVSDFSLSLTLSLSLSLSLSHTARSFTSLSLKSLYLCPRVFT